jgi:hypothetical protein
MILSSLTNWPHYHLALPLVTPCQLSFGGLYPFLGGPETSTTLTYLDVLLWSTSLIHT